ncbi:MAG: RNA-binding S4 domain-containing protein [Burkholderiaceae bacterium]|nr:RNA-binding S4 domain-containing protein [Burkholderiaceae bacterium]
MSDDVRIDKWLWAARLFRTRSLAADAVERGQVRLDELRVKPARPVRIGDRLEVRRGDERIELIVQALSATRGPAPRAGALQLRRLQREPALSIKGRPSKRDARALAALAACLPGDGGGPPFGGDESER